jgi:ribonucleoside-diphosphate reductase alpha chain
MDQQNQSLDAREASSLAQKSTTPGKPREVEAINGYYKKVVLDTTPKYSQKTKETIMVTHRDGTQEPYNADRINLAIERASRGITDPVGKVMQIASETELAVFSGITTEELDQAIINTAVQNIKEDPEFDTIATRLLLKTIYKKVLGDYSNEYELEQLYRKQFASYIQLGVEQKLLDARLAEVFDLEELSRSIDLARDELLKYIGLTVMMKRYMIRARDQKHIETPQYFWMRAAMGLAITDENPTQAAKKFYHKMSSLEYIAGGSTLVNVGTPHPTLSNCYLLEMHDDINHIGKTTWDVMRLSKATGGIGLSVTKLRAEGSPIRSNNTFSSGPIPFMHTIDSTLRAVSRAGKKMGALCFYMENWHLNFPEFLDLKQQAGDEYRRTRTANTAVFISDEFMKRVKSGDDWYLFDPLETPELGELYGNAFSKKYHEYIEQAEAGKLHMFKKIKAREQFRAVIIALQTTSHPWLTWKDAINVRALNNNTGTIHLSNLCTEICLPQDKENIAVCNLTSINLSRHLVNHEIDYARLETSVRLAVRQLDNLLDINQSPVQEAAHSDKENRAIGLGLMGFTDTIELLGYSYDSEEAYALIDKVMEFISYMAIDESANLAQERGAYPNFEGSGWSKGLVPYDTLDVLEQERGEDVTIARGEQLTLEGGHGLNWNGLREKVKQGMRNATLMAVAPNANIGLVAGTTPGIDPRFAQVFSRSANTGKFLELNRNLVLDLKKRELWESTRERIIESYGDLASIEEIPEDLKKVYQTSFQLSPHAFIEIAGRAQKWIDQAMSRNMYLATRDIEETMQIYITAWEKGLKTTYYLHMQPRHQAEQSTTKVNKSASIGKLGFGVLQGNGNGHHVQQVQQEEEPSKVSVKPVGAQHEAHKPSKKGFGTVNNSGLTQKSDSTKVDEPMSQASTTRASTPSFVTPPKPSKLEPESDNNVMVSGKGFADVTQTALPSATAQSSQRASHAPDACPIDPQDRLNCESCQ